jgi:hypothetical protein
VSKKVLVKDLVGTLVMLAFVNLVVYWLLLEEIFLVIESLGII